MNVSFPRMICRGIIVGIYFPSTSIDHERKGCGVGPHLLLNKFTQNNKWETHFPIISRRQDCKSKYLRAVVNRAYLLMVQHPYHGKTLKMRGNLRASQT